MAKISKLFVALCLVAFSASAVLAGTGEGDGGGKVQQPTITAQVSGTDKGGIPKYISSSCNPMRVSSSARHDIF
jgi:hypothetical protein